MGRSLIKRRVSAGTHFSAETMAQVKQETGTICPMCSKHMASEYDHILACEFADMPEAMELLCEHDLSSAANCWFICGACHNRKSREERYISSKVFTRELAAHYRKYLALAFTATGKRRKANATKAKNSAEYRIAHSRINQNIQFLKMLLETGQYKGKGVAPKIHGNAALEAYRNKATREQIEARINAEYAKRSALSRGY